VLLIDELDRTDEAFEAFLLEVLADFQVTIPELGTIKAEHPPIVIITSNRTREIHDALKRRCLYHWVDYPDAARELEIVRAKVPGAERCRSEIVAFVQACARGPVQGAGRGRDARLGDRAHRTRRGGARSGDRLRHARRAAEVPGRHRADRGPAKADESRAARQIKAKLRAAPARMSPADASTPRRRPARPACREHRLFRARAARAPACRSGRPVIDALEAVRGRRHRHARGFLLDAAFACS
jgi:hypothetical protein